MRQQIVTIIRKLYSRVFDKENFAPFNKKVYSQNGEDGIIEEIFRRIGTNTKYAVEFGVEDGAECNTRYLKEKKGWDVLQMDGNDDNPQEIKKEYITPSNINKLFAKYKVPKNLDLLSIDIDSNDLWVWKALSEEYKPRVIITEYNATIAPCFAKSVAYERDLVWKGTNYFGASLLAFYKLAQIRGYELVTCDNNGVNAFFVRSDLINSRIRSLIPSRAYRAPGFGYKDSTGVPIAHLPAQREFVDIDDNIEAIKK